MPPSEYPGETLMLPVTGLSPLRAGKSLVLPSWWQGKKQGGCGRGARSLLDCKHFPSAMLPAPVSFPKDLLLAGPK